ncbi:type I-E CRISPR-associated protein Cas7/Cse4/CasC [Trueperella pyogenes]|uniref:Type I-E CRISPR-associated protein Cas7/Cse4/CasC n=1 Tax=Trueperella pyogenes TaxID=1661 RepID=A0A3Q9GJJ4_9ACTO|nr:type I-E CRISPR-associated protein Cas7/Cse4/CasC [Trueperella pyogenes]AWG03291.1 type I-E CRISPR-associated protein Cas7/Cse4/CasC [Trueperella pyogenes]AWG16020.1 type I-E CRISPR-associated protein Cas7/Cse4/CasC [Trueperella pyogenes]AZR04904.1 type I-E CRISPR-associated protein Cas7/Cse4/CasC [Trueperella pyogenes]AZR07451.1 type I-E CRISPR-associated protein Cas7/Cse4/CasC [Trueperella pyogenes]QIU85778.1 type I-E CRISPR-associated protein Cas7/Cse4/CasC [Trueperella pyogenes]
MTLVIDIHALQTVPPSLINRDDTGAPKSAIFGGVPRQRVSSQAWKRAIRRYFENEIGQEAVGLRSRNLPEVIVNRVMEISPEFGLEEAIEGVQNLFKAPGAKQGIKLVEPKVSKDGEDSDNQSPYPTTAALLFLSPHQIERAAQAIVDADGEKITKAEATDILDTKHSVDMAMFGRMLADAPAFNIDASVQVAHAIGVHESEPEFDYYTAVDDVLEDAEEIGAGMIGTTQMMSSTLYRFATINVEGLATNLGNMDMANKAAVLFIKAFIESMPTGKQNSFANNTLPELVYVAVRNTRSVSLVNAFEDPVGREDSTRRRAAAEALAQEARDIEDIYGMKPLAAYVLATGELGEPFSGLAENVTFQKLSEKVGEVLATAKVE